MARILVPLPRYGFDPSEAALPFKILSAAGHSFAFATPDGRPAAADRIMLTGERLGFLKGILAARRDAVEAYFEMEKSEAFQKPLCWDELREADFEAVLLPGGHDKGVRECLESAVLQRIVGSFFEKNKPVAAICHGVVLAARSKNAAGRSVLFERKTTCLLASQELLAFQMTRLWLGDYYLTYPGKTVESEIREAIGGAAFFEKGPLPIARDSAQNLSAGFAVRDGNFASARWPGDVHAFSKTFLDIIEAAPTAQKILKT